MDKLFNEALEAFNNGNIKKSINLYENILKKQPDKEVVLNNLAYAYFLIDDYKKSEKFILKSIEKNSSNPYLYYNLGNLYKRTNNLDKALSNYNKAISIDPKNYDFLYNKGYILLKQKKYNIAWDFFENRIKTNIFQDAFSKKIESQLLKNKSLLKILNNNKINKLAIISEQGLGDQILFGSMFKDLIKINTRIKIIINKRLINIFTRSFKDFEFIDNSDSSKIDQLITENYKFIYAGSLGQYFRRSITDFSGKSFLKVDSQKVKKYKSFLTKQGFKKYVGISWKSSAKNRGEKSVQLKNLISLFDLKDIGFVNLQYGDNNNDLKDINLLEKIINISDLDLYNEIDDVIALIECLDLVVTTPNVNVHFAGAIGKSCMVLSPLYNEVFMYSDLNDGKCEWYKNQKTMVIENNLDSTLLKMKNLINSL